MLLGIRFLGIAAKIINLFVIGLCCAAATTDVVQLIDEVPDADGLEFESPIPLECF